MDALAGVLPRPSRNFRLGIDLVTPGFHYGLTPNDLLDPDTGGNGLQNFPVLTFADGTVSNTTVHGSLNSVANQVFTLEFFASPTCDPTGYGEGKTYLGSTFATTSGTGNAAFSVTLPMGVPTGSAITATASQNATSNTSEFSACVTVSAVPNPAGDIDGDGDVDLTDRDLFVAVPPGTNSNSEQVNRSDLNGDGLADARDVPLIVTLMMGS